MNAQETISVIIPCYNNAKTLRSAVLSALNSTWRECEIIIVDDGSADDPEATVGDLVDNNRVQIYRKQNAGLAASRDFGVKKSSGRYVSFLDADDEIAPDKLASQWQALQRQIRDSIVFCGTRVLQAGGTEIMKNCLAKAPQVVSVTKSFIAGKVRPSGASMFMARDLYDRIGGFSPEIRRQSEFDFLCRAILYQVEFLLVARPGYIQHLSEGSNRHSTLHRTASLQAIFQRLDQLHRAYIARPRERAALEIYVSHKALLLGYGTLRFDPTTRREMLNIIKDSRVVSATAKVLLLILSILPNAALGKSTTSTK